MFSMPWPGGTPPEPPLMTKKFQKQNNLAYRASEKSRLGKVEEVGSFVKKIKQHGGATDDEIDRLEVLSSPDQKQKTEKLVFPESQIFS